MSAIDANVAIAGLDALGWALVHFVWQGVAIAVGFAAIDVSLRGRSPHTRYVVACLALAAMFTAFVGTVAYLTAPREAGPAAVVSSNSSEIVMATAASAAPGVELQERVDTWARVALEAAIPWLIALWLVGVLTLSMRVAGGWALAQRLKSVRVTPAPERCIAALERLRAELRVSRPVLLCESGIAQAPAVIGWLRPVILVPASTFTGLTPMQVEAIVAHELAHIRRNDYLVNLLQTAVETLLFYHPAVWWVSRRIREEREHCCDDVAVATCGDVLVYARALAELEALRPVAPRLAVAATGGPLLRRIERLLSPPSAGRVSPAVSGLVALAVVAALGAAAGSRFAARAEIFEVFAENTRVAPGRSRASNSTRRGRPAPVRPAAPQDDPVSGEILGETEPIEPQEVDSDLDRDAEIDAETDSDVDGIETDSDEADDETNDYIERLAAEGYRGLSVPQLVALRNHGVSARYIAELRELGLAKLSVDELVSMSIHGVSSPFVREMRALGYGRTVEGLLALRIHGVSSAFLRGMADAGYRNLPEQTAIAFRIHGVSPNYVEALAAAGYRNVPLDELLSVKIHGIGGEFVREMSVAGYGGLPLAKLIQMRIHGVTPAYVSEMKALGYSPSADELVEMRIHGVSARFVRKLADRGMKNLSVRELIQLRIAGFGD